ncbi:hypothetical protein K1T71_010541 [Dendrolimus kikuchii]|uniref:Uncharacterized protein n=1 Tax=Dendrolimus kikuchii TaxID=765133 RepID=A0ACC1CSJ9_9NEOP|nr:hypothetical protein K1T71_010541 [Dendrolimus kikuchii]
MVEYPANCFAYPYLVTMCSTSSSPNCGSVRRVIDINYANKKRATSFKWMFVNIALLSMFAYDLWRACACACPGGTSGWHYAEAAAAAGALANLALHVRRLLRRAPPAPHSPHSPRSPPARPRSPLGEDDDAWPAAGALRWRAPPSPPRSPPSPQSPPSPPSPSSDAFIADAAELAAYLRAHALRPAAEAAASEGRAWPPPPASPSPPPYQLASSEAERGPSEESGAARAPQVWRRLHLDPQRLTQWNLNLRLWLHLTILERLVREMDEVDAALGALGVEGRLGALGVERLRALCGGAAVGAAAAASLRALLPFLEPFADQRYAVQRVRELARDGCLGAYKWAGGGGGWEEGRPSDAELVLHLFATYLDGQAPGGGRAFSGAHLSAAPASPPRGPRALSVHRATLRPPHYVLVVGEETVEVCAGRNNLLHTLLVLVAALAAHEPPALRLQLGRAGLNLLWVIGR